MTQALIGYMAIIAIQDVNSPTDYIEFAEVTNISPPNPQVEDVDATHMQSPGRAKEYIPGLTDYGESTYEMNYIPSSNTDDLLLAWRLSGDTRNLKLIYPSAQSPVPYDTFPAYFKGLTPTIQIGAKMTATLSVKVAGLPVRTN